MSTLPQLIGFLQRRAGERAVAHVGHGDLDRVLVHVRLVAEDLGGDDDVLREVLGHAAADHEEAGHAGFESSSASARGNPCAASQVASAGCLAHCAWRPDGTTRPNPAEQSLERRAEDRHVAACRLRDDAVRLGDAVLVQVLAHGADELAAGIRARGSSSSAIFRDRLIADAELVLVDVGVVDAVDVRARAARRRLALLSCPRD